MLEKKPPESILENQPMCIFSADHAGERFRSVEKVSGTNIFARSNGNGRQILVYSMNFCSRGSTWR